MDTNTRKPMINDTYLCKTMNTCNIPRHLIKTDTNLLKTIKINENQSKSIIFQGHQYKSMKQIRIFVNTWQTNLFKSLTIVDIRSATNANKWKSINVHEHLWKTFVNSIKQSMQIYSNALGIHEHRRNWTNAWSMKTNLRVNENQ